METGTSDNVGRDPKLTVIPEDAELKLRLRCPGQLEQLVVVNRDPYTLGRAPECDLPLPFSGISRLHARLARTASGVWTVEDMGSKNGTFLNGQSIGCPQPLQAGDIIGVGDTALDIISIGLSQRGSTADPAMPLPAEALGTIILRSAQELQQQWTQAGVRRSDRSENEKVISRLRDLVEIAKALSAAVSIEEIFSQVKQTVFRNLNNIDRLALLVDVTGSGRLELVNAAARDASWQNLPSQGNWISRSICQKAFIEKAAIQTADAQSDGRFDQQQSILSKEIRTALAVPLWDENRVVGVLYADAHVSSLHWTEGGDEDLGFFSALANLVAASVQRWLLATKLKREEEIRQRLQRYHSPAVIQQMMMAQALESGRLPPREGEISILFADIVRFTDLAERLAPDKVAELLNVFFEEMLEEIFAVDGTLDKFIGDCIMAFFGAPEPQANHADRAVAAARGMQARLRRLNARNAFGSPLQLRIAINSGTAVVGDVGSAQRVDYTALGATINLASRMETICPPTDCVVSEATYRLLTNRQGWQQMGQFDFKGIQRPVHVYRLSLPDRDENG